MSRFQQIRVRVEAHYAKSLAKDFPALHGRICKLDNRYLQHEPPLMELVPVVARLGLDPHVEPKTRQIASRWAGRLEALERQAQNNIASWLLAAAEQDLARMDELFMELEEALAELD
ncbi:hypothetical protein Deba_1406 [Desulfarculus baarsii DSM 2075]|uniref:Uncharacterized protein n=1 Tax=Desulfarculus baarsii (strain ATCC 33931 / DSM 2075 / LMG 7858 / VKM B-1802 / 2st14) TaxID=644282 RepID=E1QGT1_DESB2|nr:hypothetical protein [Desulfarculus baarsii]ADK84774.1 hypothetical protein Deba_1406 [Desulfarculus baarsii DSM 2075]